MKIMIKKIFAVFLAAMVAVSASGCKEKKKNTEIVLTTDFAPDEVFRIDSMSCFMPEIRVYMNTSSGQYEQMFGSEIWDKDLGGITLGQQLKDTILARLAQIKVMTLLAQEYDLSLSDAEMDRITKAADKYISSMKQEDVEKMGIDKALIADMYSEYALANKVYEEITKDINPEISDDEARTIKVKHILLKTYMLDANGEKVEFSKLEKKKVKKKAETAYEELVNGTDFDEVAQKYNQDDHTTYSFMKGDMPKDFEDAAFNLGNDEVSEIVKTEYGYHIIKCVSTFDRDETDSNKKKIVQNRKNEVFDQIYTEFVKTLYSNLNEELWNSVDFEGERIGTSMNFFENFDKEFYE